jgi:hypothetical protein
MQREVYMFLLNNHPPSLSTSFDEYRFVLKLVAFINSFDSEDKKYEALREFANLEGNNFRDELAALCGLV